MAIAFAREGHNDAGSNTTLTVTVTVNANDDVVLFFTISGSTAAITSVRDNNSVDYDFVGTAGDNVNVAKVWCYTKLNAPAATSITIIWSPAGISNMVAAVYTGVSSFGNTGTNSSTSSTNPTVSVTTQDNDNYVAAMFADLNNVTFTAQNGTIRLNTYMLGQGSRAVSLLDNTAASPSSVVNSATTASAINYATFAIELRAAAGAAAEAVGHGLLLSGIRNAVIQRV